MASAPSESHKSSPRIDYFSSLPNELLDDIFEYAYTESSSSQPLSKHLQYWFEKDFYRKVSLSSSRQFSKFATLASGRPSIGRHVRSLKFENKGAYKIGLHLLFRHLPNLVKLDIPCLPALFPSTDLPETPAPYLLRLECIATSLPGAPESEAVDLDCLAQLATLTALKQLGIYDWHRADPPNIQRSATTLLPAIEILWIRGDAADYSTPLSLIKACPALLHLEHNSTFVEGSLEFHTYLPSLPSNLHSLSIHGLTDAQPRVDSVLPSFAQLRFLRLGDHSYSHLIHSVLLPLSSLVRIHLGKGVIDPAGFVSLIIGSSRLPSLRTIILDFDAGIVGRRIKRPSRAGFKIEFEMRNCDVNMGDWSLSGANDGHQFDPVGLQLLIEVARENGVVVEGSIFDALENAVAYRIEANNRATIDGLDDKYLDHLEDVRYFASCDGVSLPPLDLDSLDLDRLEIVETELPEQEWFMLSLRNKDRSGE